MRLLMQHLGTTSPINDHPPPPPCRRHDPVASTMAACSPFQPVGLPTDDHPPRGASRVASPGQAQLQIFDLALIPIVVICPQLNHMKLDKHIRRLLLSPSVRIARSELFLYFLLFSLSYNLHNLPVYKYMAATDHGHDHLNLLVLRLPSITQTTLPAMVCKPTTTWTSSRT
jgi:hypothetical protein